MAKIVEADLDVPKGNLAQVMFRGYSPAQYTASLAQFVLEAGKKTQPLFSDYLTATGDRLETIKGAETAWAYHLAFTRLAALHANLAQSATEVNLSASYTNTARENRILAGNALADFERLTATVVQKAPRGRSSSQVLEAEF